MTRAHTTLTRYTVTVTIVIVVTFIAIVFDLFTQRTPISIFVRYLFTCPRFNFAPIPDDIGFLILLFTLIVIIAITITATTITATIVITATIIIGWRWGR